MSRVWIGTSGWTYDGWRGPFYPPKLAKKKWLCWYASQFPTTEINGSFYRTPSLEAVAAWRDQTPKDFLFGLYGYVAKPFSRDQLLAVVSNAMRLTKQDSWERLLAAGKKKPHRTPKT